MTTACMNPTHDHATTQDSDGNELAEPIPMTCRDCGRPAYYDTTVEDYAHDDQSASCFLIAPGDNSNPCSGGIDRYPTERLLS